MTQELFLKKIVPKGESIYIGPVAGITKMRYETFAFQVELQTGYQIISDTFSEPEKCGLKEMEPYKLPMIAVPTRKNFPYKELFRRQLIRCLLYCNTNFLYYSIEQTALAA